MLHRQLKRRYVLPFSRRLGAGAALYAALVVLSPPALPDFVQQGHKLVGTGSVGDAKQGTSVAVSADGNTAVVGGPWDNSGAGGVWVFTPVVAPKANKDNILRPWRR